MANRRSRTPPRKPLSNPTPRYGALVRRKYLLRHSPKQGLPKGNSGSHAVHAVTASRPVLVPLHPNLRRLPSRLMAPLRGRDAIMNASSDSKSGLKRKRIPSVNENAYAPTRARAAGRFKRQRSQNDSSEEDIASSQSTMEVDGAEENPQNWMSDLSEMEEPLLDDSDDFLIHEAGSRQLNRLRKDELTRLYDLVGLTVLPEDPTKSDIINAIITARNDEEIPPSSPPGKTDGGFSSDDGHDGGGEETDVALSSPKDSLRRRATVQDIGRSIHRTAVGRSFSLEVPNGSSHSNKKSARIAKDVKSPVHHVHTNGTSKRRGMSSQSSPLASSISNALPSPPATRLRSRTISAESTALCASTSFGSSSTSTGPSRDKSISGHARRVAKTKRVGFEEAGIELNNMQDCDYSGNNLSPRRLRSKGENSSSSHDSKVDIDGIKKRVTPMRKAKGKIGCLKEDSTATESDEESLDNVADDDEVDELDSSPSPSPSGSPDPRRNRPKEQRTPLKKRLRSRKLQTHTPPSDGDDEQEEEDEVTSVVQEQNEDAEEEDSEETASVEEGEGENSDEELPDADSDVDDEALVEPRMLRNGKIVGEDIIEDEDSDAEEDADDNSSSEIEVDQEPDEVGEDEDENYEDEAMEDEFDLSSATQKTLIRLRRDDLVRLCESRDLEVDGTKPQLAQSLLQWRDCQRSLTPAPSSSSTVRPPSVIKANGRRRRTRSQSKSSSCTPPVLMRSNRVHDNEPVTPPMSKEKKEVDGDLELDLESLGLEDREIPPDKLTKLEKIGSGGFKDVFIGKFKGRKVAIAEFRDQLSAMDIKELKLLAEFAHPNIVRFLGVSIPENTRETPVMMVSELCSNGDLFDYVRNVAAPSLYKVLSMMLDVARGLEYLHERKPSVIHRDCKSSNILITSKGTAKIADFGLAKVKQSTRSMVRSLVGTVNWQAPELWVAHPKYNHKVDVYSCACVYWEMLQWHNPNKKFPWEGMNEHAIYEAVGQKRQRPSLTGLRRQWCPDIVDLVERMWAQDHQDRPGITEVVEEVQRIIKQYR
ncbi:hypothetical protein DFH11DRAFT_990098 [Phellopilus nigrolimitatus]|nr:hypothetical protein DFH11DRAFT_990098 [Phellopilus nigrolimitatus]